MADLPTNLTGLSQFNVSDDKLNTSSIKSSQKLADEVAAKLSKEKGGSWQCVDDNFFTVTRNSDGKLDTSGKGFSAASYTPPKPPDRAPQALPPKGTSSVTVLERGLICGTNIGAANADLVFECNFVSGIQVSNCLFTFESMVQAKLEWAARLVWAKALALIPQGEYIKKLKDFICYFASELQRIICVVQQVMTCILNTIESITQIVNWILSLPARFLSMLIQCITGFFSSITNALTKMVGSLASVFSSFTCPEVTCKEATSIYDIGDTASGLI